MKYKTQLEQQIDCLAHDISFTKGQINILDKLLKQLGTQKIYLYERLKIKEKNLNTELGYKETEDFWAREEENNIKLIKDKG